MANILSPVYSAQINKVGAVASSQDFGGPVRILDAEFTGDYALDDVLVFGLLPVGARIVHGFLYYSAHGTGARLNLGLDADEGRFASNIDISALGVQTFPPFLTKALRTVPAVNPATDLLSTGTMKAVVARFVNADPGSGTVRLILFYVLPAGT